MWKQLAARYEHAMHLVRPGWMLAMAMVGAIGTAQTIWPALPHWVTQGYAIALPALPLHVWALIVAALLIVGMFEGSFGVRARLEKSLADLKRQLPRQEPEPHWIPLRWAPFDLPARSQLAGSFQTRLEVDEYLGIEAHRLPTRYGWLMDDASVIWDEGRFRFSWRDPADPNATPHTVAFSPWDFEANGGLYLSSTLKPEDQLVIGDSIRHTWRIMTNPINDLIGERRIAAWARRGEPMAEFERVEPDSWTHFAVTDWAQGTAMAGEAQTLFSIHIEVLSDPSVP
jgi:hypothetical protein